ERSPPVPPDCGPRRRRRETARTGGLSAAGVPRHRCRRSSHRPPREFRSHHDSGTARSPAPVPGSARCCTLESRRWLKGSRTFLALTRRRGQYLAHGPTRLYQEDWRSMPMAGPVIPRLVSVIMPCYNGERYLAESIDSALGQTHPHVELIVVDDGSTDGSRAVAERYGERIQWTQRDHSGIAGARNHGIEQARGEYLAFLDADDLWSPDKLERQVSALEADRSLGIVIGDMEQFVSPELVGQLDSKVAFVEGAVAVRMPGSVLIRRSEF